MSDTRALGARLLAELEAATEAAVAAHDREQARPITAADAPDSAGVFAALARIDYFNKQAAAGANTVAKLTRPAEWPTPTAQDLAAWMLDRKAKRLPLAAAVAEAAWLSPDDAHTDRERWAHRAAERWLRDFHPANAWGIGTLPFAVLFLSELVIAYLAAGRPREVLDKLIGAWPVSPVERPHETRADRRIMPALRVVGPSPERERGLLFGGLVDDRREADLPLFPELEPARLRVPLLEIVERTGLPFRSRGKGAPVESRLVVRGGLLNLRPEDRHLPVVRIAVTVGEMLYALWPPSPGRGRPRDAENWPKLLDALYRARDFHVPDAAGGRWFPMALRRLPANAETQPARDDLVILDLAPVPGAETGASVVLPLLDRMGVKSGPTWFAYLAGRSLVWLPGKTRRPVPGGRGRYGWSGNPSDYPVLMLADLARFAYGAADTRHRTRAETLSPWQSLPDLVLVENQTDERIGIRGWRLLPTEAALAMRKLGRNLGVSGRNLGVSGRNL
ncbi:MAG: hypothetical protein OXJ62_11175, partial [Spirochaetaceae bacterium]|nr:hypothetical protein [Spirochaetaceae bacterium]